MLKQSTKFLLQVILFYFAILILFTIVDNSKSAFAQETQSSLDLLGNSCKADTLNTKKRNLDFWELTTNKFNEFDKKVSFFIFTFQFVFTFL